METNCKKNVFLGIKKNRKNTKFKNNFSSKALKINAFELKYYSILVLDV